MNLYDFEADGLEEELVTILHEDGHVRVERIVSTGQRSPDGFWYDQDEDEWLTLVQGESVLLVEGRTICLQAGDTYFLSAHQRHSVESTTAEPPCIWICVFIKQEDDYGTTKT